MHRPFVRIALLAVIALGFVGTASQLHADNHHFRHDKSGYWDAHNHHHAYAVRHGHHGYWENRIWIQID